jgi:hypothetical protein
MDLEPVWWTLGIIAIVVVAICLCVCICRWCNRRRKKVGPDRGSVSVPSAATATVRHEFVPGMPQAPQGPQGQGQMPAPYPYAHPHQHYPPNHPSVVVVPTHPGWQAAPSSSSSSSGSGSSCDSDSDEERGGRSTRPSRSGPAEYGRLKRKSRRKSRR